MALEGTIIMSDDLKDILDNMYDARYETESTNTTNDLLSYSFLLTFYQSMESSHFIVHIVHSQNVSRVLYCTAPYILVNTVFFY